MRPSRRVFLTGAVGSVVGTAACTPGPAHSGITGDLPSGPVTTDAARLGRLTLTVWDQEVRGGQNKQMTLLDRRFQQRYPNITIRRVSRSFDDLTKTLRLALTGADAPDVVQANNTRSQMGVFVKAGQLRPLDRYVRAYGWDRRFPAAIRNTASYSPDARTFGAGSLYGLPQEGELIGVYVNRAKLAAAGLGQPTSWEAFDRALETLKGRGEQPLVLGNLEKWPAEHVFGVLQGRFVAASDIRRLGYGQAGGDFTADGNVRAARMLSDWVRKGYFGTTSPNAATYDSAWQAFSRGRGVFLIAGSWLAADLGVAMNDGVTFMAPPPSEVDRRVVTTGGTGLPFAVTDRARNLDAAAAYIDFITNSDAMKVLAQTGNLPVVDTTDQSTPDALGGAVLAAYTAVSGSDGLVPYLDWATPTMGDTIGAALQDLIAGRSSPQQTLAVLQKDYSTLAGR